MEYSDEQPSDIDRFRSFLLGEYPPEVAYRALASLTVGDKVLHGHGSVELNDDPVMTRWRLIGVTGTKFVAVDAMAPESYWTQSQPTVSETAVSISAVAYPLSSIRSIRVVATRLVRVDRGSLGWTADYSLEMDSRTIELPRATESRSAAERESIEGLAAALMGALK